MKKFSLIVSITAILVLTACGGNEDMTEKEKGDKPNLAEGEIKVTLQNAVDIFLQEYEVDYITKIEIDSDMDQWKYEVNGAKASNEYEVVIDALTGDVIENSEEKNEKEETRGISLNEIISPEEAMKIVQAETNNEIGGWTLEVENGMEQYEIEVRNGNEDIDYMVNAITGELEGKE